MASTDPSRRASEASSSEMSLVDPSVVAKLLPKKDSVVGKVKIKKPPPKPKADKDDDNPPSPESPLINDIDPDLRATFPTGRPMDDKPDFIQCKHCKKPMPKAVAASHIALCLQKKNDRAQRKKEQKEAARKAREAREKGNKDADGDAEMEDTVTVNPRGGGDGEDSVNGDKTIKTGKKATVGTSDKSKKRKADTEGDKEPKKKKTKKEIEAAKPKIPKPKGPVDVEKQCGVLLLNGADCARSLTCKTHTMGAKRAVPGRSLPYDMLLAAYQKKNQAKQQTLSLVFMMRLILRPPATPPTRRLVLRLPVPPSTPRRRRATRDATPHSALLELLRASRKRPSRTVPRPATPVPESPQTPRDPQTPPSPPSVSRRQDIESSPLCPSRLSERKASVIDSPDVPWVKRRMLSSSTTPLTEAAIDANAPLPDDIDASGPVDSDEETELVMAGIGRWNPQPLAQHVHVSLKRRYQTVRVKEMWAQAFGRQKGLYAAQNSGMDMSMGGVTSNINDTPVNLSLNLGMNPGGAEMGERKSSLAQQGGIGGSSVGFASNGNGVTGGPVRKASTSSMGNAAANPT